MKREAYADASLELNRHIVNLIDSLSALSGLAAVPIRDLDEPELLRRALEALMGNQDMERCSIFLLGDDGWLTNAAGLDWSEMLEGIVHQEVQVRQPERATVRFRLGEGLMGQAAASHVIMHCRSCEDDERFAKAAGRTVEGSLLCVPIACEEGVLGVLNVYHPLPGFFNLWHERLLLLFCQILGRLILHHRFTHHLDTLVAKKTEEVEEQRHFLRTVLDSAPDPMMVIGTDYRVLLTNCQRGNQGEDKISYCYRASHHRDSPCEGTEHPCPLHMVKQTGATTTVIHEHFNGAGEPRIIELVASPLRDKDGQIAGIVESARDVTESRRVAEVLRKSEERLRLAERVAQLGSWELDFASGRLNWSDEVFRILDIVPEGIDISFERFLAAVHPEDRRRVDIAFQAAVKNSLPYEVTNRVLLSDGTIKYVQITGETFYYGGKPLRIAGAIQDVTLRVLNEEALRESEERFRTIADHTYDWEYWRGPGGEFLYISPACQRVTGYTQAEFIGRQELMYEIVHPEDRARAEVHQREAVMEDSCQLEFRIVAKDGEVRWISHVCRAVHTSAGRYLGRRGSNRDITAQKQAELEYKTIVQTAQDGFLVVDAQTCFLNTNNAYCHMLGYSREEILGMRIADIEAVESLEETVWHNENIRRQGFVRFETRHRRKDGCILDVEVSATHLDVRGGVLIVFVRDITQRKQDEAHIRRLAFFDPLTGLPNRRMLIDRLGQALFQARRHRRALAVMFMDLDHFKHINDTLGHDVGDDLLKEVARCLTHCVRSGDTVARQGGDEFVIVLAEIGCKRDAANVAEKILAALAEPLQVGGRVLDVTVSIGITVLPADGSDDVTALLKKADHAMYLAKKAGRNCYHFHGDGGTSRST